MPQSSSQPGFDPRTFKLEMLNKKGPDFKDPWARNERWRYTGPFTRWNRFRNSLPGFGIACVAFAGYCAYEQLFLKKDSHGHGAEHH
ncbi:hypothetical protein BJ508DRAFT_415622 [Ascobolus immersus RN42]|uniref:NADH-ubiquinone oxidoreductase B12 subunit n=1 Tax=Ascobolus immersus RN42 TaxID=1160509 RepID=A0A3N4I1J3_ASCIM|nr:hypothetical protein BJ508DRAFT_415622 [Ascobolus immersus RN42]